jgi:hypothetical protein
MVVGRRDVLRCPLGPEMITGIQERGLGKPHGDVSLGSMRGSQASPSLWEWSRLANARSGQRTERSVESPYRLCRGGVRWKR